LKREQGCKEVFRLNPAKLGASVGVPKW